MKPTPLKLLAFAALILIAGLAGQARAEDWRKQYPELNLGVITSENQADRMDRWQHVADYLSQALGVKVTVRQASDYAGVIEAMKAKKVELGYFGPASYAKAWIVTGGKVEPLVSHTDQEGNTGYYSALVVKKDSPFASVQDLKGKNLALADPNSTSGHQAPRYFLGKQGIDIDKFFASATFSGSHENSVIGLMNGTFDAAVTWWNSETFSNITRMANKGMIAPDAVRVVWKSPLLPENPWAMPTWLPEQMRADVKKALLEMPAKSPEAFTRLFDGKSQKFVPVSHSDYEPIVRMIQENLKQREAS